MTIRIAPLWMYHNDHGVPHFHAWYGGDEAVVDIESLVVIEGDLPPRILALVRNWSLRHQEELRDNWNRARAGEPLEQIPPLTQGEL